VVVANRVLLEFSSSPNASVTSAGKQVDKKFGGPPGDDNHKGLLRLVKINTSTLLSLDVMMRLSNAWLSKKRQKRRQMEGSTKGEKKTSEFENDEPPPNKKTQKRAEP